LCWEEGFLKTGIMRPPQKTEKKAFSKKEGKKNSFFTKRFTVFHFLFYNCTQLKQTSMD